MKIVAGFGSLDDYDAFVDAGVDELYCGYIPGEFIRRFGRMTPANRREVSFYNVQIGSESELMILRKKIERKKLPVSIAFNAICFTEEQRLFVYHTIEKCCQLGFKEFILADRYLIRMLEEEPIEDVRYHLSGEYGVVNQLDIGEIRGEGLQRVIFPRQTTIPEMKQMIALNQGIEYEAFLLNEKCHFTGAYCNSIHCDEFCHACQIPYIFFNEEKMIDSNEKIIDSNEIECKRADCLSIIPNIQKEAGEEGNEGNDEEFFEEGIIGESGCGLCGLWQLREAGISHIKLVSRGNASVKTIDDIRAIRAAISVLEAVNDEYTYIEKMKKLVFMGHCGHNCYYKM